MARHKKTDKKVKVRKERTASAVSRFDISQETKNSIWGILSFSLAILSILSFAGKAGAAGDLFSVAAKALFGWGFFIIPIAFVILGASFIKSISRQIYHSAVFGTILFVFSFLALFYVFGGGDFSIRLTQGGYFGIILGFPLFYSLGFWASLLILLVLMVVALLVALNVPIYTLIKKSENEEEKLTDKVVIKRGNEIVDEKSDKPAMSKTAPIAKPVKAENNDNNFIIKNLRRGKWTTPPLDLLNDDQEQAITGDINASANIIKRTLANFGIDVPNRKVSIVGLKGMFEDEEFKKSKYFLPLALGKDVSGSPIYAGLEKMPHLLIAGATGTGKSVNINAILLSLLYKHSPDVLKMILVDPKRVELTLYNDVPHLITPVITDNKKVLGALKWTVNEMDRRYDQLSKSSCRDVFSYNSKMSEKTHSTDSTGSQRASSGQAVPIMPIIVVVIDELADLMASYGRDVEAAIVRLAQMSRAVGIHLIVSTQRPSVEVITGLIKANITSRVAFQV